MGSSDVLNTPGSGWKRLAEAVAVALPAAEIDGVWVFRTLRQEGRELGTAILSRLDDGGARRRIYTARFVHTLKGRERGKFESVLEEVGSGPREALDELLAGVRRRMDDEIPTPIAPETWFGPADPSSLPPDVAPRQG